MVTTLTVMISFCCEVLNIYEYIKKIDGENINKKSAFKSTRDNKKTKKDVKKTKVKKVLRTLWVRRKRKKLN